MPIVSTGGLIDCLREHRLLPPAHLQEVFNLTQGRCGEARALARTLIQRGWLTVFQVNQILAGKANELIFGPYHVLDRLGQGGLSHVYQARHTQTEQVVALKVIRPEAISSWRGRQQFLLEMEAMARLEHPNIVQFCDADIVDEMCYFAMEYVAGTDLGKHVDLTGPLPVAQACNYIRQAALGLQHAYERNLVHRDIKPVNLFLTQVPIADRLAVANKTSPTRPVIKVLDWGLASLRSPRGLAPGVEDVARSIVGTADYLSPEQARDANSVDIRGDIYSLGCTFYYLLTAQPPFPHGTLMQKIMQHQQVEPTAVESLRPDVPSGVATLLRRTLEKRPEARFQTPAALALALAPFLAGEPEQSAAGRTHVRFATPGRRPDDTPLPIALGGEFAARLGRSPRAGFTRTGNRALDTSCPQNPLVERLEQKT